MGSLALKQCTDGQQLSGILVKRGFNYHLVEPADLNSQYITVYFNKITTYFVFG